MKKRDRTDRREPIDEQMERRDGDDIDMAPPTKPTTPWLPLLPVGLLVIIGLFMSLVSPLQAGPAGILTLIALVYLFSLSVLLIAVRYGGGLIARGIGRGQAAGRQPSLRKAYYIASVTACLPVFLLALSSLGQLAIFDVVLVVLFVGLATFYVARRT